MRAKPGLAVIDTCASEVWTYQVYLGEPPPGDPMWPSAPGDEEGDTLPGSEDAAGQSDWGIHLRRRLEAGEIFCSVAPAQVTAYVYTGVAVCVWDPAIHVGGVQHFQVPESQRDQRTVHASNGWSVERLLEGLLTLGCRLDNLQAGLFGGSARVDAEGSGSEKEENPLVSLAQDYLESEGIPIVSRDIGGSRFRRVTFRTDEGTATVKLF